MNYRVKTLKSFEKQAKQFAKKYHSFTFEYEKLIDSLENNPFQGTSLGKSCYKIRMAISSKGKGKRGGARLITHIIVKNEIVYLMSIFDKSEKEDISDIELDELLIKIP